MSHYRQDPFINFEGIQKIQQELGRLFEGEWVKPSERCGEQYSESGDWSPATDSLETDSDWHFLVDLPGVELKDVDVSVSRGQIFVKGQKDLGDIGTVVRRERSHGRFEKVLSLPEDADESTLTAAMKNGVLQLSVNKSANSGARPIPVRQVD